MTQFAKETLPTSLADEMRRSYLDYAMSVIVGRALPDARDGTRMVQSRHSCKRCRVVKFKGQANQFGTGFKEGFWMHRLTIVPRELQSTLPL